MIMSPSDDVLPGETRKVPGSCEESWHVGSTGQQYDNLINKKCSNFFFASHCNFKQELAILDEDYSILMEKSILPNLFLKPLCVLVAV
jgi:hypothetical protein